MTALDDAFPAWKARAHEVPLHGAAVDYGANLKRAAQQHVGPCPALFRLA
ncbi:hypothetical protein [Methylopila sp. Yamaguchi]|nr:hypothetical protein [Methylopila sp. Yamaguchi]GBD48078.1 hypothetical protein METY_1291 [Methylopila sp. Yamaguchi]